jgi:uncharacterized caspase-like protein
MTRRHPLGLAHCRSASGPQPAGGGGRCCRNNSFQTGKRGSRGLSREERDDMLIVYSTRPGTLADDGDGRNSPFATSFLAALTSNPRNDVRLLFSSVTGSVSQATAGKQKPEQINRIETGDVLALVP